MTRRLRRLIDLSRRLAALGRIEEHIVYGEVPADHNMGQPGVEVRSRTGDQIVERYAFHDKNGKEVTQKRYEKLIPSFRGRIDTTRVAGGDWSAWSKIYGASGQEFQSPSPRRWLQFEVRMTGDDPERAAELKSLAVNFSETLARGSVSASTSSQ